MRLFLAINLPAERRASVAEATAPLRDAAPDLRWVKPELLHLTVKFLGEQPEAMVPRLAATMRETAARHRAMDLTLSGVGAFPNFRRPRVVWVGVDASPRLELLFHDTELACERLGFPLEGQVFRPHVTIGRVRPATAPASLAPLARAASAVQLQETAFVETLDLMMSQSGERGPRYTVLDAAPLRGD